MTKDELKNILLGVRNHGFITPVLEQIWNELHPPKTKKVVQIGEYNPMLIHCDGFMIGCNPSQIGGGYTVTDDYGNVLDTQTIQKVGMTNNETELLAVLRACELANSGYTIQTDSQNARIWSFSGRCRARPDLNDVAQKIKRLLSEKHITLEWASRNKNKAGLFNELVLKNAKKLKKN